MLLQGNQGQTGKQVGQNLTAGFGEFSDLLVTELMPCYYEQTYRGNKYSVTWTAAALAAAASASSFVLSNPPNSGKNLVLIDSYVALTSYIAQTLIGTAAILGAAPNFVSPLSASSGPLTPVNTLIGSGNNSVAKAFATATLGVVPVAIRTLAAWVMGTATPGGDAVGCVGNDMKGIIIVAPGSAICIFGLGGAAADLTIQPTLTWDEVPV